VNQILEVPSQNLPRKLKVRLFIEVKELIYDAVLNDLVRRVPDEVSKHIVFIINAI